MSLLSLKKEGWFNNDELLHYTFNRDELETLQRREKVEVSYRGRRYSIYIRPESDSKSLLQNPDVCVQEITKEWLVVIEEI